MAGKLSIIPQQPAVLKSQCVVAAGALVGLACHEDVAPHIADLALPSLNQLLLDPNTLVSCQ